MHGCGIMVQLGEGGGGVPRAWETKRGRAQGKDINSSHQMQKKGGEGGTKKQSFFTGPPSNAAAAGAARVQTNPQTEKIQFSFK